MVSVGGVVEGGRVIPDEPMGLPDGSRVSIQFGFTESEVDSALREEFRQWQELGANAWDRVERMLEEDEGATNVAG